MFPYGLLPFPDEFFFLAQWWFRIATTIADKPLDPKATPASAKSCSISISPVRYRHSKAPACSLDKPGRDCYHGNRKGAATAVSPQSKSNKLMLTVWEPAKRSTRFYGEYVGRKGQAYKKLPKKVSHTASPPFSGSG